MDGGFDIDDHKTVRVGHHQSLYIRFPSIFYVKSWFQRLFVDKLCGNTEAPGSFAVEACKAEKGPQMSADVSITLTEQKGQ